MTQTNMNLKKATLTVAAASILAGGGVAIADNQTDPYTDRGDHYEITIDTDIQKGEKVKVSKARPEVTLERWGGEESITVRRVGDYNTNKKHTLSPIRGWKGKGEEVITEKVKLDETGEPVREPLSWLPKVFAQEATSSGEGFKIDILLDEKPNTNVFEYQIEGYEDLDFFYQPPLTETEIAEGSERPENVVGSYAVYHKTKANHKVGSTNYATGKLFHIYRPKVVDADGNETWATLSYDAGVLSVTVPRDFLDNATYPVRVDPTFGITSIGASSGFNFDDWTIGTKAVLSETADITTYSVYMLNRNNSAGVKAGLYTVSGSTLTYVTTTAFTNAATPTGTGWKDITGTASGIAANTYYILAIGSGVTTGNSRYDNGSTNDTHNQNTSYAAFPDATQTLGGQTRLTSIYATYTVAAGGTTAPNYGTPLNLYE